LVTTLVIVVTPGPGVLYTVAAAIPEVFFAFLPQFVHTDEPNAVLRMLGLGSVFMLVTLMVFAGLWRVRGSSPSARPRSTTSHDLDAAHLRRLLRGACGAVGCLRAMT